MTIRATLVIELLKTFPKDATVRGFEDGLTVMNADGTGQVVMLNEPIRVPTTAREAIDIADAENSDGSAKAFTDSLKTLPNQMKNTIPKKAAK